MGHPSPHPILAITLAVTILDLVLPADSAIFAHIPTRYPQGFLAFLHLLSAGCILQSPISHLPPASCVLSTRRSTKCAGGPSPRANYSNTHLLSYSHPSHRRTVFYSLFTTRVLTMHSLFTSRALAVLSLFTIHHRSANHALAIHYQTPRSAVTIHDSPTGISHALTIHQLVSPGLSVLLLTPLCTYFPDVDFQAMFGVIWRIFMNVGRPRNTQSVHS